MIHDVEGGIARLPWRNGRRSTASPIDARLKIAVPEQASLAAAGRVLVEHRSGGAMTWRVRNSARPGSRHSSPLADLLGPISIDSALR